MKNEIISYRKDLKTKAREMRKDSTLSEVLLWQEIRKKQLGFQFHRQVPKGGISNDRKILLNQGNCPLRGLQGCL
ncbi:DUF559 domain-containing protein [Ekhidna sp.]|uniref:DUF559 domain-containing protein n=1 Tax=Ekhidna sp. TaxID=2608089 RepID=UPI003CCBFD31